MSRIRVFVSSTIRDLQDVRSAIRFWLEELGYEVLLSESSDFDRRPDSATFDACFEAIRTSDYYILLVGSRVGSEYADGVSVTRQEFRVAMEHAKSGRPYIVSFVRRDVDQALAAPDDETVALMLDRTAARLDPDRAAKDAAHVRAFVNELHA